MTHTELIQTARTLIQSRFIEGRHHIGSALVTRSGNVFTGVHLEAYIGRVAVCGEAIAIGAAATGGDTDIEMIVAVNELGQVVSPCGMCRELIGDYAPAAKVIIPRNGQPVAVSVSELLPDKYQR
ncbi:cytidine deaminase [bacterium]|nr:cytidine deaminase [bacterium]